MRLVGRVERRAAIVNRAMQLSPGSTDIGIATYASFYNVGIVLGSLLGAWILDAHGARPLPLAGIVFIALALTVAMIANKVAAVGSRPSPRSR